MSTEQCANRKIFWRKIFWKSENQNDFVASLNASDTEGLKNVIESADYKAVTQESMDEIVDMLKNVCPDAAECKNAVL